MARKKTCLILISILCITFAFLSISKMKNTSVKFQAVTPAMDYELSKTELEQLPKDVNIGDEEAAYRLYLYYEEFLGDEKNGKYWLNTAASLGQKDAQKLMGYNAYEQQDLSKAIYWFEKVAKQGEADGMLEDSLYLKQTERKLISFIKEGNTGDEKASYRVYKYYTYKANCACYTEKERSNKHKDAINWLALAAKQGHVDAQYQLGQKYESKWVLNDPEKAIYWYKKAEEQGFPQAKERLEILKSPINKINQALNHVFGKR